ncbi:ATP phosphoribosyltransferase (ATP-PRTase) (ATP-PRT) [Cerrena zonata]|uniref:ATP phosphoribosyltransferase n=1 Tax=Cerrena zonata TaxID=2478898 RepID=A0AAW0FRD4_9APHY
MDLVNHLPDRLLFAVPKKGRLYEKCCQLLSGCDIQFRRSNRLDIALSTNLPIALIFLPAADIPIFVGDGNCDLGITGLDQIKEADMFDSIEDLLDLNFGKCKLQIQVPAAGDIKKPEQLIAAQNKSSEKTSIRYVGGSVEASCALGVADAIVDLVESGETMKAAGLEAIDTLLDTSAHLISSKKPKFPELVDKIHQRFEGVMAAQKYVLCTYNAPRSILPTCLEITPGRRSATISALEQKDPKAEEWVSISSMIEQKKAGDIMDDLKKVGASDILLFELRNCRV